MVFRLFMLIMTLVAPLTMLIFGRRFMRSPPQEISAAFGYRTNRSCQNHDTWEFAHRFCGRLWYGWGLILLPLSVLVMLLFFDRDMAAVSMGGRGTLRRPVPAAGRRHYPNGGGAETCF